ncbi:MAG: bifunctional phosphoribosylaminoimidazolecarboxamide formyltransferase/IMP cyclohydrolase [Polyangiaceae bacterium]
MPIRRALLSVSDKTGLVDLARVLVERDVALLSTGGTQKLLEESSIPVTPVERYTESPEVMAGRVKTLHPRVHGGLLAREGVDEADLTRIGASFIDLLVVNLYPFAETLKKPGASFEELIENIDIGGPSMLRSAAKNHERVTVVCEPADYPELIELLRTGGDVPADLRRRFAHKAFAHTAAYDAMISNWLGGVDESDGFSRSLTLPYEKAYALRYGENPHQRAAFYRDRDAADGSLARAESLGSGAKELSFNNLVDVDAALEAVREFPAPAAVVVKHASPCGIATAPTLAHAYHAAREADAMSAFGGIVALNREVDLKTAELLAETFLECIVAPSFCAEALERLRKKSALRLLATGAWLAADHAGWVHKRIGGGIALQSRDDSGPGEVEAGRVVSKRAPSPAELHALNFAWNAVKHVRSNAIVLARQDGDAVCTSGIGGGQTARVLAVELAVKQAGPRAAGSVLASDAFFPFPDGVETAAKGGVKAIVQPGGSKKDDDVIAKADDLGLAMIFTGKRHFRH